MKKWMRNLLCAGLACLMLGCAVSTYEKQTMDNTKVVEQKEEGFDYSTLVGNYQDSTSQRATMEIVDNTKDALVTINWSNGADNTTCWQMHVQKEGNKFVYVDGKKETNGVIEKENQQGYFELKEGKMCWTGADEESCKTCVFEKV